MAQAESEAAATGPCSPLAAPGSGLHWKSWAEPWCPTNFLSHGLSRGPLTDRNTRTLSLGSERDIVSHLLIDTSEHSSDQFMWPRNCPDLLWLDLRQRNWKWSKVGDKSQNAVFLRKESLLWGGGKFQCWHRKLFGEWTAFYWNRRIEIASGISILFESEYTHFIECWNDFTNFYNMLMDIMIMCNSKYFFSLKSCQ